MLSRRQFLQAAGITLAAAPLARFGFAPAAPSFAPVYGRALTAAPIYAAPDLAAPVITQRWSDTIAPILDARNGWYRLADGYTPRESWQPLIVPAQRSEAPVALPDWGEVTGALAVVRAYCAADAPIVTRIGHGGVLRLIDYLPGTQPDDIGWYGVADDEDSPLLGWTQTPAWSSARADSALPNLSLRIDQSQQKLEAYAGDHRQLSAPISTGRSLEPGVYPITRRRVGAATEPHGAAWLLDFGKDQQICGVYWHNRFGQPIPGAAVQITPALAQWLFPRVTNVIVA